MESAIAPLISRNVRRFADNSSMAYSAAVLLAPLPCMRPTLPDRLLLSLDSRLPSLRSFIVIDPFLKQPSLPFRNRRDEIPQRFACTKLKPFIAKLFSGTVNTSDDC